MTGTAANAAASANTRIPVTVTIRSTFDGAGGSAGVRSAPSSRSSSNSQPSPYGSALIVSGLPSSVELTAVMTPGTGLNRSETLLVDSSSPQASPLSTASPTVGSET